MPLALTGYEIGLLVVALFFISFALVAALVVPRARPDFPAKRLGVFIAVCIGLFLAQIGAVLALAELGEEDEPEAAETQPTETETGPAETGPTETTPTETDTSGGEGDSAAGKGVFLGAGGCGACHTLADAGTTGTIGPNLDDASPSYDKAVEQVTNGGGGMPAFRDTLSEQQIQDVAAYVSSVTG